MTRTTTFRIFLDMDGVIVDFESYMRQFNLTGDEVKRTHGAYLKMEPIEHAIWGVRKLMSLAGQYGGEVWLATKPPTGIPHAYADKVSWVLEHLPELKRRIILTHDKGLLGGSEDILVDDRPHRANCVNFRGALVHFGPTGTVPHWHSLVDVLHRMIRHPAGVKVAAAAETEEPYGVDEVNEARALMGIGPLTVRQEVRKVEEFLAPLTTLFTETNPPADPTDKYGHLAEQFIRASDGPRPLIRTAENSEPIASIEFHDHAPIASGETLNVTWKGAVVSGPDGPIAEIVDLQTGAPGAATERLFRAAEVVDSAQRKKAVDHGDTTHGPGWVPHDQPKA